jgi:hypothetical protein
VKSIADDLCAFAVRRVNSHIVSGNVRAGCVAFKYVVAHDCPRCTPVDNNIVVVAGRPAAVSADSVASEDYTYARPNAESVLAIVIETAIAYGTIGHVRHSNALSSIGTDMTVAHSHRLDVCTHRDSPTSIPQHSATADGNVAHYSMSIGLQINSTLRGRSSRIRKLTVFDETAATACQ